jgi:hypothetical protein
MECKWNAERRYKQVPPSAPRIAQPIHQGRLDNSNAIARPAAAVTNRKVEGNHQGKDNQLLTPLAVSRGRMIHCHQRLGGLLKFLCPSRMNIFALRLHSLHGLVCFRGKIRSIR